MRLIQINLADLAIYSLFTGIEQDATPIAMLLEELERRCLLPKGGQLTTLDYPSKQG